MIIQMDNCSEHIGFRNDQIEPFINDLNLARQNGYIALLFFHVHICPNDEKYSDAHADKIGDRDWANINLNKHGITEAQNEASAKIIDLIKSSPDVIKGCFCGHMHSDFYCELTAKDGKTIPQYLLIGTPYDKGHILNIHIK